MEFTINIARAAENSVISCTGSDCGVCSLLQTISNIYNFFLAVSFAVAVLVLVIAGVNYLINGGDRSKIQKSLYFMKSGIIGFALIILGWIVIQSVIRVVGYQNAGQWWSFQCGTEEQAALTSGKTSGSQFPSFYDNLKTFPDLTAYLKSGEKQAKIRGPVDAQSFSSQLKNLKNGESLRFLAPVRLDSINGAENLFLPLLTVKKDGENLKLDSTGEYWNLIQNQWPRLKDSLKSTSDQQLLDKLLGTNSFTDNRSLITANGTALDASLGNNDLSGLYKTIAGLLGGSVNGGDRSTSNASGQTDLPNASLSDLIAMASSYNQGDNPSTTDQMIGNLTTQVLKLVSNVMVDKVSTSDTSTSTTSEWRCTSSGGEWANNQCQCPNQNVVGDDGMCHDLTVLKINCETSGGAWSDNSDQGSPTPMCGSVESASGGLPIPAWEQNAQADSNQAVSGQTYCKCKDNSCLNGSGACLSNNKDNDGDKIANGDDQCPNTPSSEKGAINTEKGGQYYGCSCSEIGTVTKACPPDQCVGDNWVTYPNSSQACQNGLLSTYSCDPVSRSYDEQCVDPSKLANGDSSDLNGNLNSNTNSNSWAASSKSPFSNSTANQSQTGSGGKPGSTSAKNQNGSAKKSSKPIKDDFGDWNKSDRNRVPNNNDPGESFAGSQGVKEALKRIYQKDKLRYLMIFKYTSQIYNQGGGGGGGGAGLTWGCGTYSVTFGSGYKMLASIITHECTHSGDFCNGTIADIPSAEYVAVGNEIGSVGKIKESPGQKEEVKVNNATLNGGKTGEERLEVRGYQSRWLDRDIDPTGDTNPTGVASDAGYAKGYKDASSGSNWVYGWPPGGDDYTLRLSDNENNRVLHITDSLDKLKCAVRPPDDMPQLTVENGYKEEYLQGCKPTDTATPVIKFGN